MTRGELFAVVAGAIGFVADIITIVHAARPRIEHGPEATSTYWPILMAVTTIYEWIIFAWFLTKWRFARDKDLAGPGRKKKPDLNSLAIRAVLSI